MKPVNLLPQSSRPYQPSGKLGGSAYWVVGGLLVVLLMAVGYVMTKNTINSHQTELTQLNQETEAARQRAASMQTYGDFAQVAQARLESVRNLATVRFDWERLMREVSHVIPSNIWLLDMSASTSPQGSAGVPTDGAPATSGSGTQPSLKVTGCASGQDAVAVLMVRLRKLHDAEEVTLSTSTKQVDSGTVAAAGDSAVSSTGCPGGRYKFEVTVDFEAMTPTSVGSATQERVPASLGGGS